MKNCKHLETIDLGNEDRVDLVRIDRGEGLDLFIPDNKICEMCRKAPRERDDQFQETVDNNLTRI